MYTITCVPAAHHGLHTSPDCVLLASLTLQWHTHTLASPVDLDPCQHPESPYIDENLLLLHIKCLDWGVWGRNETAARRQRYAYDIRRCSPLEGWVRENGRACGERPSRCHERPIALPWRAQKRGIGRVELVPEWLRTMRWEAPTPPANAMSRGSQPKLM